MTLSRQMSRPFSRHFMKRHSRTEALLPSKLSWGLGWRLLERRKEGNAGLGAAIRAMRLRAARTLAEDRYSRPLPEKGDPGVFSVAVFLRSSCGKCPVTAHYRASEWTSVVWTSHVWARIVRGERNEQCDTDNNE